MSFEAPRERVWDEWTTPEAFAERLVLTVTDVPDDDARDRLVVELTDLGDGRTEMHFEQWGDMSPESYERAAQGWGGFFDRLDQRLET